MQDHLVSGKQKLCSTLQNTEDKGPEIHTKFPGFLGLFPSSCRQFFSRQTHKSGMDKVLLISTGCVVLQTWCNGAQTGIKMQSRNWLCVCVHSSHLYVRSIVIWFDTMPKSCFNFKHQWPYSSLRCGPVYNSTQPGSSLKNSCQKGPPAWFCDELTPHVGYLSTGLLIFRVWTMSLRAIIFSVSVLLPSFLDMSGSQRKNSWRRVLTVSGHSIMTMWLPSSITFRNANKRI